MTRGTRVAVLTSALAAVLAAPAAPETRIEKSSPLIRQYYHEALQAYTHGDYRGAIIKWTAILKEDPDQRTAPTMILDARQKIAVLTKERREKAFEFIGAGRYRDAFGQLQDLLDQDPGDPELLALQSRLEHVIKLTPRLAPQNKAAHGAILGLKGYLSLPPDLKLAYDGLRYAHELAPADDVYKNLLAVLLTEFPGLATSDSVAPGMKLLEYKHYVAMHQIYDGKYHTAILTLDEILALEPRDLMALKRLGSAYYSLGHMEQARAAWSTALELAPKDKVLRRFLAKTRAARPKKYTSSEKTP